jgi:phage terminase large subunit
MPTLRINKKLEPFLTKPKQLKIAIGGRGSGKSIGIGDALTFKMATEKADIYCLREFQDSISDSVHRVFEGSINDRLMLDGWNVQEKRIISPEGAQTAYKGAARNPNSIQSAQGYKYSWFEEAQTMSQASIDKLLPTILRNPGAECWFSANPQSSADPFSQRFIVPYLRELNKHGYYEDDLHLIIVVNWRDNPWWNIEQETLRKWETGRGHCRQPL